MSAEYVLKDESDIAQSEKNNSPVGSGPFKFKEWKKGESLVFERNAEYFGGEPKADMVAMKIIPNEASQAISYVLDRNEMIESAYDREGFEPAKSLLVPSADVYTEKDVEAYDHDLDKAKELLSQSGVTVDKLNLGYNTGRFGHKNYALVAQQELKELGIEVELVLYESKAFFNVLFSKSTECDMFEY